MAKGAYRFTNPRMVLIQECKVWIGYEAAHYTWAADLAQAMDLVPPYLIYVLVDNLVPPPKVPKVWLGTHRGYPWHHCIDVAATAFGDILVLHGGVMWRDGSTPPRHSDGGGWHSLCHPLFHAGEGYTGQWQWHSRATGRG